MFEHRAYRPNGSLKNEGKGNMNPATFLHNCERIVTGIEGLKVSIPGLDINSLRDADGIILTASTEPGRNALETNFDGVDVSSSQTDLGSLTFMIPRSYDATIDKMRIRFLVQSAGDTNTPTIDCAMYRKRAGAALTADIDPTISAAVNNNTTLAGWVEIVSEGDGWEPGDAVTCIFTTSAHTTDALNIYALEVVYISDLAYWEEDASELKKHLDGAVFEPVIQKIQDYYTKVSEE